MEGRQSVGVLTLQELYLDTDIATIDTAEVQALRVHIQEIPGGEGVGVLVMVGGLSTYLNVV